MQDSNLITKSILFSLCLVFAISTSFGQTSEKTPINLQKARVIIDSLDNQFSEYYFNGDSTALVNMYTKDGSLGSLKGDELRAGIGRMIRNSIQTNTRKIIYTTTSLTIDKEFIIEVGTYEAKDDKGISKGNGKYLVVWKQENGDWKLYRDIGL